MPNPILAYDDGLLHSTFKYTSDANVIFNVSIRTCYVAGQDGVISVGANPPKTPSTKPKALKPRHLVLTSQDNNNGKYLVRKVPCNLADINAYFGTPANVPGQVVVDGEAFYVTGFHGETWRG